MTLIRWNNPGNFSNMLDEMMENATQRQNNKRCGCGPATNIMEKDDSFKIEMAVPGFQKEDITINFEDETLTISSEKEDKEKQEAEFTRKEFGYGAFKRSFMVPKTIEAENIEAEYTNGILSIALPKKKEAMRVNREIAVA